MGWTGNRFFRLLLYGGISTILLGAFTGGWFGNIVDMLAGTNRAFWHLKRLKDAAVLLDPMKEPMRLLVAALSLGLIQIWFGHIVAIYGNIKNRRYLDALLDQGSILLFLFGFTGAILIFLSALPKGASSIFTPPFAAGAVAIALTSGRANPGLVPKLGYGLFNLYSVFSGYISDLLSYSRLWALGLVTGVMGATFNLMGAIIGGMVPGVGFVVTAFIIFAGHTMSILMNLLGAFIHPMRLQFVEFFSKFFRGGGRDFKPLALENRFTVVE
jgi:V/A-type H+-transporting ATPase subunit I